MSIIAKPSDELGKYTRKRKINNKDEDDSSDEDLESFLFGKSAKSDMSDAIENSGKIDTKEPEELLSFSISTKPGEASGQAIEAEEEKTEKNEIDAPIQLLFEKKPAWEDPDDENISIELDKNKLKKLKKNHKETSINGRIFQKRLKEKFEKVLPPPAWADINSDEEEEKDGDKLFKTTSNLYDKSSILLSGALSFRRMAHINKSESKEGITCIEYHPSAKLVLTSTMSKRLSLFQADGESNKKLQSIYLDNFPISTAHFACSGTKIVVTAKQRYFQIFELTVGQMTKVNGLKGLKGEIYDKFIVSPDGNQLAFLGSDGFLHFASSDTLHYMYSLKMNGSIDAAAYQSNDTVLTTGGDGEVYVWDLRKRRCTQRFVDEGSIGSTAIACSSNKKFVAVGSKSGIVNIYQDDYLKSKNPTPVKTLKNLLTEVDGLKFNPTCEMLAYYSQSQRQALKLLHFPSLTTFNNWPGSRDLIGHVTSVDFSPLSGYMALANDNGYAQLYRLNHYPDA